MPASTDDRVTTALDVPLVRALGCTLLDPGDPASGAVMTARDLADSGFGGVHASAVSVLLELAGFLAVAPSLGPDEHAVTHMSSVQLVAAARVGQRVEARGVLDRRGRRLAFLTVVATVDGAVVARAQLTKSIVGV